MTFNVTDRFDAPAAWAALPESVRTAIGTAVLNGIAADDVADYAEETDDPILARVARAAAVRAEGELDYVLGEISLQALVGLTAEGEPRIPAVLGMICEGCGCTEFDACPGGCGWARDNLCTVCAGGAS